MKNFILTITVFVIFFSCNNDIDESINESQNSINFKQIIEEKYDGEILKFENEDDFIAFYNLLAGLDQSDFNYFLTIKGDNNSGLYRNLSQEEEILKTDSEISEIKKHEKLIISEYLSTIFNYDNEVIIGKKTVSITESGDLISYEENKPLWI